MPQNAPAAGANPGLGGLNLSALAAQGGAETGRRIEGQSGLIAAYLDQVLGQNDAKNAAGSERDERMIALQRQQAMMQEALQRSRMGQTATLQRARLGAAASEGNADRAHRSGMADDRRIFELGQAAVQRPDEGDQAREALENRMLELQILAAEKELGPQQSAGWGRGVAGADRGAELSRGRQNALRKTTFTDRNKNEGTLGFLPGRQGNYGAESTTSYDDLMGTAEGYMDQYGEDPNDMVRRIKELARGRPQLASLLLHDIGYNPGAYLAPEA